MRKNVTILVLALLVLLSACSRGRMQPTREVDVADQFGVAIPSNLVPCSELHEFAPLQYADERGGYFLLGIQEAKEDIVHLKVKYKLADYASFVENTIGSAYDTIHVSGRDTLEVNGLRCQTADMIAAVDDGQSALEVYYHLSVFESDSHFYQLIGWTRRECQSVFQAAAHEMDLSFHELSAALVQDQTASAVTPERK
jgi:hypothetical protein